MNRAIQIELNRHERKALIEMAAQDMRSPWDQARFLVAQEARRRGLITDPPDPSAKSEGYAGLVESDGVPFGVQS